jgi:hypothetical protein
MKPLKGRDISRAALFVMGVACAVATFVVAAPTLSAARAWSETAARAGDSVGLGTADDPNGFYGGCRLPEYPSGVRRKSDIVREAGGSLFDVSGIEVIDCHGYDGSGGSFVVPCPSGREYAYCVLNENDGAGNHVLLGVIVDIVPPRCKTVARRRGPVAQVDLTVHDPGTGIHSITLQDENNVQTQHYFSTDRDPLIVTATKVDQGRPASFGMLVRDGAGNLRTCSTRF